MASKLYHYTTAKALVGILCNQELWSTDFRFLNDSQELRFAKDIVKNTLDHYPFHIRLETFINAHSDAKLRAICESFLDNFKSKFFISNETSLNMSGHFRGDKMPRISSPHVFSLSSEKDCLSQWRAYGNGELCIEFDASKLMSATNARTIKVSYLREGEIHEGLYHEIDSYVDRQLDRLLRTGNLTETSIEGARDLGYYLSKVLVPVSLKHNGFREECEWRLIKEVSLTPNGDRFIDAGRYPIRRVKLPFRPEVALSEIVTGVVFGPGSDHDIARASIDTLNMTFRLSLRAEFSEIPFRT